MTDIRGQRLDDRQQRTEIRGQISLEFGRWKKENRGEMTDDEGWVLGT